MEKTATKSKATKIITSGKAKVQVKAIATEELKTAHLLIDDISLSPFNHRKIFHTAELQELAENIKEVGILQPIVVRRTTSKEKPYELVCGERRVRSSVIAGLTHIYATIRVLTDEQAFDIQLMENLQRVDVHAMEQAWAYRDMVNNRGYSVDDIAAKLFKPAPFIAQRLKLNDLIDEIQEAFKFNEITIGQAVLLARISEEHQQFWTKSCLKGNNGVGSVKSVQEFINNKVNKDLSTAVFPLDDETLLSNVSACNTCPKNSLCNANLFADVETPTCFDSICFKAKTMAFDDRNLKQVIENEPGIILFNNKYWVDNDSQIEKLKDEGYLVAKTTHEFRELSAVEIPEVPVRDDFEDDEEFQDAENDYKEELADYESDLAEYEEAKKTAQRAYVISGDDKGTFLYGSLITRSDKGKDIVVEGSQALSLAKAKQIDKRERSIELDQEKVFVKVVEGVSKLAPYTETPADYAELNDDEKNALLLIAFNQTGYGFKDRFCKAYGISSYSSKGDYIENFNKLISLSPEVKSKIVRSAIQAQLSGNFPRSLNGEAMYRIGRSYEAVNVSALEEEQQLIRDKRELRINERITLIDQQIKELEDSKKELRNNITEEVA